MRKLVLFVCIALSSSFVFAQSDNGKALKFAAGVGIELPTGNLKEVTTVGFGIEGSATYTVKPNLEAFLQTGVHVFKKADITYGDAANLVHVPIIAGVHYRAGGLIAGGGIGIGIYNGKSTTATGFLISPQAGWDFGKLQVLLDYTLTTATGGSLAYFGAKAYYKF